MATGTAAIETVSESFHIGSFGRSALDAGAAYRGHSELQTLYAADEFFAVRLRPSSLW
jgi:hypothetical protein